MEQEVLYVEPAKGDERSLHLVVAKVVHGEGGPQAPASPAPAPVATYNRLLYFAWALLLVEYLVYFAFQLISYLLLHDFWRRSGWYTGLALFLAYAPLCVAIMFLQVRLPLWARVALKVAEFAMCFFLLGWLAGYGEFATISMSYLMVANIIVLFAVLKVRNKLSIASTIVMLGLILADMIAKSLTISAWYFVVLTGLWDAFRMFSLHYTSKLALTDPFNVRKTSEFTLKLWYEIYIQRVNVALNKRSFFRP